MPSVSKKQHNFMAAIANNPSFAKKAGVPQSVGQDFTAADKGRKFTPRSVAKINNPDTKHGAMDMPNANLKKFSGMKKGGKVKRYNGDEGSDVVYSSRGQGENGELLDYQRRPQADVEESSSMGGRGGSSAKTKSTPVDDSVNAKELRDRSVKPPVDDRNELRNRSVESVATSAAAKPDDGSYDRKELMRTAKPTITRERIQMNTPAGERSQYNSESDNSAATGMNKKLTTRAGRELTDEQRERNTERVGDIGLAAATMGRLGLGRLLAKEAVKSVPLTVAQVKAMRGAQEAKEAAKAASQIRAAKQAKVTAKYNAKGEEIKEHIKGSSFGDRNTGHKRGGKITKTFKKGGNVMESKAMVKKEVNFFKKKGAPASMVKHEEAEMKGMKKGGMTRSSKDVAKDQQSMSNMATYARGGGIESRGKTKGAMVKMATGGVVKFARGGGIESRGKTRGTMC
jgi:hypothetical protein